MELKELRGQINEIDAQILDLFQKRMDICCQVAEYKIENDLPIFHPEREQQVIEQVRESVPEVLGESAVTLFTNLMDISKCRQFQMLFANEPQLESVPLERTGKQSVAVPGTIGSYTHAAANKLLPDSEPQFFESFAEVFAAVESGTTEFGVVPINNSTAGTVNATYELMSKYDLTICAATKVSVNHSLCIRPETNIEDVHRVYSHEQALMQCSEFLAAHGYSARPYVNTSLAASRVKESDEPIAAICSEICAKHFGLKIVSRNINNADTNFTRFIMMSKKLHLDPDANMISVCLRLPHQTSALYRLLTKFSVAGLNLTKIESRPVANTDFDVMFYLDFEGSVTTPVVLQLIRELKTELKYFKFLGNYREVL
ncbi:chorismate mutase / prephenate dehydratase [Ruminococcus sp. YE71]|uniref:bifunctional chorismate mutase/prephenate dehydratase n=1 Tax=unclassified Ruminococcus TaxID=2608920 RepID=UPI000884D189|nr:MULTISPECIES: bifunctional chorismate mutase/prephenate dehydratase [unclassified Ruminococcus]SDA21123.1 chorismate mutase / prephenate dehydratase [Ruminococcus sp. YE78]SFW33014.1 chorismate mutase / prephenate dehydratase [Ruminococcus sp. YE71]